VILLGWLLGGALGVLLLVPVIAGMLPSWVALILIVLSYLGAYTLATLSVAPLLPRVSFPLLFPLAPPGGAPVCLACSRGELFARGALLGITAGLNAIFLLLVPVGGELLAVWAFVVVSLATLPGLARSRLYHGVLGWTAWLLPVSYPATAVGLLLFLLNAPVALGLGGIGALRIDWRTGVIESAGGLVGLPIFAGVFSGFSLGNFNFLYSAGRQDSFSGRGLSSHEVGHSLNTAAFGGIVLWINAVDENLLPRRINLAYGELAAQSYAQSWPPIPGAPHNDFFISLWG
jgi:hypothetical protein